MSKDSKIEWTGDTHQFVSGCGDESPGCANCYAKRQAYRMASNPNAKIQQRYRGLTVLRGNGPQWTGEVRLLPEQLAVPLSQKKPRTIFVNSLSDTFHADIPDEYIAAMFGVMAATPQHTYQVLTKRAILEASRHLGLGTNNHAELSAVRVALAITESYRDRLLVVRTDSQYTIGALTAPADPEPWAANAKLLGLVRRAMVGRAVQFEHVKGHAGIAGNERADHLAGLARLRRPASLKGAA